MKNNNNNHNANANEINNALLIKLENRSRENDGAINQDEREKKGE